MEYQLYANDTYREVWAVRRGRGYRVTGLRQVPVTTTADELPTLDYQTESWRIQWWNRNIKWFRRVNPAVARPDAPGRE